MEVLFGEVSRFLLDLSQCICPCSISDSTCHGQTRVVSLVRNSEMTGGADGNVVCALQKSLLWMDRSSRIPRKAVALFRRIFNCYSWPFMCCVG